MHQPSVDENAGRCDICGSPIDMSADERLVYDEYGVEDEIKDEYDLTDEDAIEAVASALESVAGTAAGRDLAEVIRETGKMRVHQRCLDQTNYSMLERGETA